MIMGKMRRMKFFVFCNSCFRYCVEALLPYPTESWQQPWELENCIELYLIYTWEKGDLAFTWPLKLTKMTLDLYLDQVGFKFFRYTGWAFT